MPDLDPPFRRFSGRVAIVTGAASGIGAVSRDNLDYVVSDNQRYS